ncbi:YifB family Mg chelatase-like AAA ATPase [Aggregicoccus sp. 17bor-14]|uniref:YifB family Mg chelatase-like AAA ATPase n=1 Tax=Myxococcaceae TaxID=31 RepID=UPI00129CBF45|nr:MULTISPECIES: YifB family Mg chelatase-like AAA ATPase [Myxococcaceae]MBF5043713.1 YifB family Mg chelatase-like AAA ATPase [Simulacricoccus sp. 17bor-14]MRI89469.1 YifB family Mg chelatase-like AAA ATPase [Aggregicoccus sp. 17bor-14]
MLARVRSGALVGIDAVVVDCEVDMALGLPYFNVVGLPDGAARESKVRVVSALKNSGYDLPQKRITVNLAPADIRKEGAAFELPIALGVLAAARLLDEEPLATLLFGGELSLDGAVKPIRGVLPLAVAARDGGYHGVMVPAANAAEAALVEGLHVYPVRHLREAVEHLAGTAPLPRFVRGAPEARASPPPTQPDMSEVRGQPDVKLALELAAAGGHNVLMSGPPGSGKTMLARRLPGILPAMTFGEALEVTKIYSVLGLLAEDQGLLRERPFRSPHHTISDAGLVGGGPTTRPGELSLAHHGVLFLDELPEFRKNVLEVLRQPLEEGVIHLARASQHLTYPCRVMLVAAMNPCPCGFHGVPERVCRCKESKVDEYKARVSGPLLDRVDMTLQTRPVGVSDLYRLSAYDLPSSHYRARVEEARERQRVRFRDEPGVHCNAQMTPRLLRTHCRMSAKAERQLAHNVKSLGLSARAHDRILKIARSRADLEGHERIEEKDMHLALSCRVLDRRPGDRDKPKSASAEAQAHNWDETVGASGH